MDTNTDFETLVKAMGICLQTQETFILWGGPGGGKTSLMYQLAKVLDMEPIEMFIGALREPTDILWEAYVDNGRVCFDVPGVARRLLKAGKGILFLDEGNNATPAVQGALLRVLQEHVFGEVALPPTVAVALAANPVSQAAGGWQLAPPYANRLVHLWYKIGSQEWADRYEAGWPVPDVVYIPPTWRETHFLAAKHAVADFIRRRGAEMLYTLPEDPTQAGHAWPSNRTWDTVARLLAACWAAGEGEGSSCLKILVTGAVGLGAGTEFLADLKSPMPDVEALLAQLDLVATTCTRQDIAIGVCEALLSAIAAKCTKERWLGGWGLLRRIAAIHGAEIIVPTAKHLAKLRKPSWHVSPEDLEPVATVLEGAGVL